MAESSIQTTQDVIWIRLGAQDYTNTTHHHHHNPYLFKVRQGRLFSAVSGSNNQSYGPHTRTQLLGGNVQLVAMLSATVTAVLMISLGCLSGLSAENTTDSGAFILHSSFFFKIRKFRLKRGAKGHIQFLCTGQGSRQLLMTPWPLIHVEYQ